MNETKQALRTRKYITNALMELMIEKDFEEISVTDICEQATITRATFYKYFEDKYHLAQCALLEMKEKIFDKELENFKYNNPKELYLRVVEICIDFVNSNQKRFVQFVKHSFSDKLRIMILQTINDFIENLTKPQEKNFKYKIPVEVISKFITGGLAYFLLYTIENNKNYSKQEMLKWADEILSNMIIC